MGYFSSPNSRLRNVLRSGSTPFLSRRKQLPSHHQPTRQLRHSPSPSPVEESSDQPTQDSTNLEFRIISSKDKAGIRRVERMVVLRKLYPSRSGVLGLIGHRPDHYTCKICEQKGHWIQECPEKEERDAARNTDRMDIRKPLKRRSHPFYPVSQLISLVALDSGRMLVLFIESEGYETSHRLHWIGDISHSSERTTSAHLRRRSIGRFTRPGRWSRPPHSRSSSSYLLLRSVV